jgi:hypothetical protein
MNIRLTNRLTAVPPSTGRVSHARKKLTVPPNACDHYWIMTKELRAELTNDGLLLI